MRGLLWMLSALLLLESTDGATAYDKLPENEKQIVDKAIKQANKDYGQTKEIGFFSVIERETSMQMVHVILSSISCDKEKNVLDQKECRPWVSCVACGDKMDCERRRELTKIKENVNKCIQSKIPYLSGGAHPMAHKGGNKQEYGCLGCI